VCLGFGERLECVKNERAASVSEKGKSQKAKTRKKGGGKESACRTNMLLFAHFQMGLTFDLYLTDTAAHGRAGTKVTLMATSKSTLRTYASNGDHAYFEK
jgi:hypothetical protein